MLLDVLNFYHATDAVIRRAKIKTTNPSASALQRSTLASSNLIEPQPGSLVLPTECLKAMIMRLPEMMQLERIANAAASCW
jgi:hypothetical protein